MEYPLNETDRLGWEGRTGEALVVSECCEVSVHFTRQCAQMPDSSHFSRLNAPTISPVISPLAMLTWSLFSLTHPASVLLS